MTGAFFLLVRRDLALAFGGRGYGLPVVFFLAVIVLYPFGVGSDAQILRRTGAGMIWVAALLAAVLPIDRLVQPDSDNGVVGQLSIRNLTEEWLVLARIVAHMLAHFPPLILAGFIAAGLFGLDAAQTRTTLIGLAIAAPGLAGLAVMIAALTAGLKSGTALGGLLMLPLAVPMLIFGAGSAQPGGAGGSDGGLLLLAASSLVLFALSPFAAGAAIRAMRD